MKYEDRLSKGLKNRKNEIKMMNYGKFSSMTDTWLLDLLTVHMSDEN